MAFILALSSLSWNSVDDFAAVLVMAFLAVIAGAAGFGLRALVGRWRGDAAERGLREREAAADAEIEARLKAADIAARAETVRAKEEFEASTLARKAELTALETRLAEREIAIDARTARLEEREAAVREAAAKAETDAKEAARKLAAAVAEEERVAGLSLEEARKAVMVAATEELRADAASLARRIQEDARDEAGRRAAEIVADAVWRCACDCAPELSVSAAPVSGDGVKGRVVGRDGRNIRAFEAATGVTLVMDDAPDAVVISSFDPVRREIARRALEKLIADGRIHPESIEREVAAARASVGEAALASGEAAAASARVAGLAPEILRTMGMLSFRTSFAQNVLRHSVEVARLSGTIAEELGLDGAKARRIGFLHDIGKALDSKTPGPHAAVGAAFLREHGEDDEVTAAVAAHHPEAKIDGGVWAVVCSAADAISSSRPGARRESEEGYVERLVKIEELVGAMPGVAKVYAVQAGREIRVMADPKALDDAGAELLARDICRSLSEQLRFPGRIRVTVIREKRITEYAC